MIQEKRNRTGVGIEGVFMFPGNANLERGVMLAKLQDSPLKARPSQPSQGP